MKKLFSVWFFLCWLTLPGISQGRFQQRPAPGKLEAMKTAFITSRLNLTTEEAQKFWPIYNQYSAEIRQAYINDRAHPNAIALEETLLNIKKKYSLEFTKAIPPPKINDFFLAEREWIQFLQKELQRRQNQRRPYPGP